MDRINKSELDPLPLYDNIEVILTREEKKVPEREGEETDEDYRERLIQVFILWPILGLDCFLFQLFPVSSYTVCEAGASSPERTAKCS